MYDYFMEKFVWQMFILGTGEYLSEALNKGLGGVIYFARDINTKNQFIDLIKSHRQQALIPPFLSIDQEGGRVERTKNIHAGYLSQREAFNKGEDFLSGQADKIGKELKEYGINLNFAPCADVNTNPDNPIIGERAFSDNTEDVLKGTKIVSEKLRENGIIPCIKHYPGHGDADKDSHLTLPEIDLPFDKMLETHIKPFKIMSENNIEMIMAAHLHCSCFDKEIIPSSLSKNAIGYLRNTIGFDGVIISDDMVMKGVQGYGSFDAVMMGIEAGLDMFIYRDADREIFETVEQVIKTAEKDEFLKNRIKESFERIIALKQKYNLI